MKQKLKVGDLVRVVSIEKTKDKFGYEDNIMMKIGEVGTIQSFTYEESADVQKLGAARHCTFTYHKDDLQLMSDGEGKVARINEFKKAIQKIELEIEAIQESFKIQMLLIGRNGIGESLYSKLSSIDNLQKVHFVSPYEWINDICFYADSLSDAIEVLKLVKPSKMHINIAGVFKPFPNWILDKYETLDEDCKAAADDLSAAYFGWE